ncbi:MULTISPECIES: ferrochelatase [unclassified Azospirillum]|uniref:ferrochelatase n=1 Tax=unclassified Azospirillum TaxID=2630922 RepID=UPI000B63E2B0|nr:MULTISPECIES: ferrochelatase [unclassified Azospirillum]SNS84978.1 ferrochelatase [Azospirillum sp. RU38E]SNT02346.1 ferrochelatase [Azospirillum sp. RU37A]
MPQAPSPHLPAGHPPVKTPRVGVLLINLGTPEGTDYWSMRRYLSEFLSDRRVVEVPRLIWQPILQGIILTFRPKKSGHAYAGIWNRELDESPLKTHTREQALLLSAAMAARHGDGVVVEWGMRYGHPSTAAALERLTAAGCERILLFPLYPQYSATTTATACDQAFRALMAMRRQPALRTVPTYHDEPAYISALATSVRDHLAGLDWTPDLLITSFHGLPKAYLEKGDPYHCYCLKTARLLREELGWTADKLRFAFQSRFGRTEWLQPYLEPMVKALPEQGVKNLAIMAPAFVSDCVETLEEVNQGIRETFLTAGGQNFTYIPCLNSSPAHIDLLVRLTERELGGWV